ncbi:MAG: hypothetical protein KGJ82_19825 [Nitrospirota bacterium]|nr:hypothetical protein [Nitrospirota bacterium]
MLFSIRRFRRFLYNALSRITLCHSKAKSPLGISRAYWVATLRRSADATGETLSLTVTLPNEQCIDVPQAVVQWSRGQEFAVENLVIAPHTRSFTALRQTTGAGASRDHPMNDDRL